MARSEIVGETAIPIKARAGESRFGPFSFIKTFNQEKKLIKLQKIGLVAEWLRSGLQNRLRRFNSGPGLQTK